MTAQVSEDFASALHEALGLASDMESVARIKAIAAAELRRLDPKATIRATDYFNHSFVHDFELSWTSGSVQSRKVFLRFAADADVVVRDLHRIAEDEPTVLALEPLNLSREGQLLVDDASVQAGSLVIDQPGLEPLIRAVESGEAFTALYASAIARSGRGLQAGTRAADDAGTVASAYAASIAGETFGTVAGMRRLDEVLKPAASGPMRQLLEAVWSGDDEFPGAIDAVGQLSDESVIWLLDLGERADVDLWRRVARRTDLSQLERIAPLDYSANFQLLIEAGLDRLHAKAALVKERVHRATDGDGADRPAFWGREGDALALDLAGSRIVIGSTIEKVRRLSAEVDGRLPSIGELAARRLAFEVPKLKVDGNDFDLEAVTKERGATDSRTDLERAQSKLGKEDLVSGLDVALPGGGRVAIDFRRNLATSVAASNPYLVDVVRVAGLLLGDPGHDFVDLLDRVLPKRAEVVEGQESLDFGV